MTAPADLILTNAEVHTLTEPDEVYEAVAVRGDEIVRVDSAYEVGFLEGVDTTVVDLDDRVVLPGFVDAHTHLETVGRSLVHADLRAANSREDAIDRLAEAAHDDHEWILGYGYDESTWPDRRYLTRPDLDEVSRERPVVAFREDMHVASLNGVALDRLLGEMPDGDVRREDGDVRREDSDVRREDGEPSGVVVEDAVQEVYRATEPDLEETRRLLVAAQERANELGVTAVQDMARRSHKPRVYRDLDAAGELSVRVRVNYWADHLDAVIETGLGPVDGSDMVRTGAIKTYIDGSIGARTAKLTDPYHDGGGTGQWVVDPADVRDIVDRADGAGLQVAVHAIGDEAIRETLDAYGTVAEDAAAARHRVEHAEVLTDDLVERFAETGAVASVQPNFLKWARADGLYESCLGPERTRQSNRYRDLLDAGVPLAFGSDCMPLDPLFGVGQAVTAPHDGQRLTPTEALRAYTSGAAYAGFDEDRLGTIETGKKGDLVALESSPWSVDPQELADIDVSLTVVDGAIAYREDSISG